MKQSFWLRDRFLGEREVAETWTCAEPGPCYGQHLPWHHLAFFCCQCGELWGRVIVEKETDWTITTRICERHPELPPSALTPWWGSFRTLYDVDGMMRLDGSWPRAVIEREFWLLIEKAERRLLHG